MYTNIHAMAALVAEAMVGAIDANRKSFIEMDDFESVFESWFDMKIAPYIPEWNYTMIYNEVYEHEETQLALSVIKTMIAEERQEFEDRQKHIAIGGYTYAQMRERGLSQKDFI